MLSTAQEALDYCAVHPIDSQALHWRVPTSNELLMSFTPVNESPLLYKNRRKNRHHSHF